MVVVVLLLLLAGSSCSARPLVPRVMLDRPVAAGHATGQGKPSTGFRETIMCSSATAQQLPVAAHMLLKHRQAMHVNVTVQQMRCCKTCVLH